MASTRLGRRLQPYQFRPHLEALEDRQLLTAGGLDPTFGAAGLATTGVLPTVDGAQALAVQSDGKAVLVGDDARTGVGPSGFSVVRLNTDGRPDPSFGVRGGAAIDFGGNGGSAQAVALQPDGKIVVAGYAAGAFAVCRLNHDGTLDTTFGTGGEQTISFGTEQAAYGSSVVVQPDGKIVVAGYTSPAAPSSAFAIARLNKDGRIDTTFGVGGKQSLSFPTPNAVANSLALQSDGKIVVAGYAETANRGFTTAYAVARLNPDGSPDGSFGAGGEQTVTFAGSGDGSASAALVQPGGKIVLAGQVISGSGSQAGLARLNGDGSLDRSFGTGGEVVLTYAAPAGSGEYDSASSLVLQADGKLVVAGSAYQPDAQTAAYGLARLNPDGRLDATFAGGGRTTTAFGQEAFARGVALAPDGKVVVAGGWTPQVGNPFTTQWAVARYAGDRSPFSYDQAGKTLTVTATNFVFSQSSSADTAGVHPSDAFTANGVPLHLPRTLVSSVVVNGGGTGSAALSTNDTYTGTDGETHETVESVVLGNGKGKLYQGGALPFLQLNGFTTIDAYMGHADSAALHATPGVANVFITTPSYSYLSAPGSSYVVFGARSVYGYAAGPADVAYQYGGSGPTSFVAMGTTFSSMTGTDHGIAYYNEAVGFTRDEAIATPGSQNTAYLEATTSGEAFVGRTGYSYLYRLNPDGTFAEVDYAQGFTHVFATAAAGATDYAYLYDTTVNHATGFHRLV